MERYHKILIIIFLITLGFRLFFVFQTPHFSTDDAYFELRHTNEINQNFKPLFNDELSYGGRFSLVSPLYHYFLAGFNLFLPKDLAFKLIPEILLAALVFIIFFIAQTITKNTTAALLSALMGGFIPILITETLNSISIYSVVLVLLFYVIYCLLNLNAHINKFIILAFVLPLFHPFGFVLSFALLIYILLLSIESIKINQLTKEAVIFFVFVGILINLIIYKKAFLSFGLLAVWQNLPNEILMNFFKNVNILDLIYGVGVLPLILGIMGFFFGLFKEKKNTIYLLGALILTMFILLFLRLITFSVGVMFLGLLLTIMSALALDKITSYIKLTKFNKYKKQIFALFLILIIFSLMLPSFFNAKVVLENTISEEEVNTLKWIGYNTPKDKTVLSSVEEGNYITAIANRKNVADTNFLLAPDRYSDVVTIYTTESLVIGSQLLNKYDVDYIYLSKRALDLYNTNDIKYIEDENCFKKLYGTEKTRVYKFIC